MDNLNPHYVLSPEVSCEKLSPHGLHIEIISWKLCILKPHSSLVTEL